MVRGKHRSAQEVLEDHLRLCREGRLEDDLARNIAEDVVLLTGRGVYRGHDGVRRLARFLKQDFPDARYEYVTALVDGETAFLEWRAESSRARVRDGADSFLIRNGKIVAQTIHYTPEPKNDE
ncbi:MAG TPA: nuclear transport factor 2 family protein [Blastocatellia bacterium]|nr:nuclear transport factor 2 family protein [Blastocatellia bacterium]